MSDKATEPSPTAGTGPRQRGSAAGSRFAGAGRSGVAPHAETYRPGVEPTAPGSLKAPDTHNSKLDSLGSATQRGKIFR